MKKGFNVVVIMLTLTLVITSVAFAGPGDYEYDAMKVKVGDVAPDFTLKDFTTGKEVSLSDYKGKKYVLIQFWATWCAICKREIPFLVNHHKANIDKLYTDPDYNTDKDKGDFEVFAILLPSGDKDKKKVEKLIKKFKISYPILIDEDQKVATEKYELSGLIPVIAIVDKEGIVQFVHVGEINVTNDPIPFVLDDLRGVGDE
ncbi:redoxin domain-containing protein [Thermodesulfobacteriota bacterium]